MAEKGAQIAAYQLAIAFSAAASPLLIKLRIPKAPGIIPAAGIRGWITTSLFLTASMYCREKACSANRLLVLNPDFLATDARHHTSELITFPQPRSNWSRPMEARSCNRWARTLQRLQRDSAIQAET